MDARTGSSEGRRIAVEQAIRKVRADVVIPGPVVDAWVVLEQQKTFSGPRIVYDMPALTLNIASFVARHEAFIDAAFGVSPLTTRVLRNFCKVPDDRVFLVPTGVYIGRETPPMVHHPIRLLYVGRFDSDKRPLDAIPFMEELRSREVEFTLTMIGSGEYTAELESLARQSPDRLVLLPSQSPSRLYDEFYPEQDAIVLFSPAEGLPNAILEGMSHGLVPITSDFKGRRELGFLRDGETALVFDIGDVRSAADKVMMLTRESTLKARIGGAARQLIIAERSVETMTSEFVKVLEHSLASPARLGMRPVVAFEGESRLRRLVGPRIAEGIRRLLGRSFAHPDASEWPLIDSMQPENPVEAQASLHRILDRSSSESYMSTLSTDSVRGELRKIDCEDA